MLTQTEFLGRFLVEGTFLALSIGNPESGDNWRFIDTIKPMRLPTDRNIYFAPAVRNEKGNLKESVQAAKYLWVDVDDAEYPESILPASMEVWSGHGWHLYYEIPTCTDKGMIERLNKLLAYAIPTGDRGCWNCNRFMRVPGTMNVNDPVAAVEFRTVRTVTYQLDDFDFLAKVGKKLVKRICSGSLQGYKSRSERDFAVVCELIEAGASDRIIELIFRHKAVGDRYREDDHADDYLERTIENAREKVGENPTPRQRVAVSLESRADGYYALGKSERRVSTFTLEPKLLLDGSGFDQEDALVCDVVTEDRTWTDVTFSRRAFTSVQAMFKECRVADWQWLGSDADVRLLLPLLIEALRTNGGRRVIATPSQGLHKLGDTYYFVGDRQTAAANEVWERNDAPIAWLPSSRVHSKLDLRYDDLDDTDLTLLRYCIPQLNEPGALWCMLGWYAAAALKPWLKERDYRFPMLHPTGTKGSGKTSLVRLFMALFGQSDVVNYDAGTTKFVVLSLLGGSNAIPVSFSEFRFESVEKFQRYILLAYDTGHDPRGRADQTTTDYPLAAPFSVDGEDMLADPAVRERIIVARLVPVNIEEGSKASTAYAQLRPHIVETPGKKPIRFGAYYMRHILRLLEDEDKLEFILQQARDAVLKAYPSRLPDRVRNNYTVCYFGALLFAACLGIDAPAAETFNASISAVVNLDTGRSATQSDEFIESILNALASGGLVPYRYKIDKDEQVVWYSLRGAHDWWLERRTRQRRPSLERDAIRNQLMESAYTLKPTSIDGIPMYGVSLTAARDAGLDIPDSFQRMQITL